VTQRVSVAGIVKSAATSLPLAETKVTVMGTEKLMTSNQEGLFFFDDLHLGNYVLTLNCPGYLPQNCNVLVDGKTYTFKEVLLTPER
jgi:glycine/serine hydroxymethyltransferase